MKLYSITKFGTALSWLMLFILLAACGSSTPLPTPAPTSTAALPSPTSAPPTLAPTAAPIATPTVEPTPVTLDLWQDATNATIGVTKDWTNKVELADINGDGQVDILFANGGNYDSAGDPTFSQVFLNQGANKPFQEATQDVFGPDPMLARVIKVRDVNSDAKPDIMVGTTFQTQSRLYLGDGSGKFTNVTDNHLPKIDASVGDLEFGDVDGDGDLDVAMADWGPYSPMVNNGGRTMLWLNDGTGHFTDVTAARMPDVLVKFSWEIEFVDIDNDYDLDLLVSCKKCAGNFMFENDGTGKFANVSKGRLFPTTNNYDFEAMDLNGDGYLDLATINDGLSFRDHIFLNNQNGRFEDATKELLPDSQNATADDNMAVFLDFDSDGDADLLIGALAGPDRLLVNDGAGHLRLVNIKQFSTDITAGTLGIAVADLNGDHKLDIAMAQGENPGASEERIYLGKEIAPDTAAPIITLIERINAQVPGKLLQIRARVHDGKSPTMPHDWQSVVLRLTMNGQTQEIPMDWYGEYLWRATLENPPAGELEYQVCASDAAGNKACAPH